MNESAKDGIDASKSSLANPTSVIPDRTAFELKLSVVNTKVTLLEGFARQRPERVRRFAAGILKETATLDSMIKTVMNESDESYHNDIRSINAARDQATLYYEAADEDDIPPSAPIPSGSGSAPAQSPDLFRFRKIAAPELTDARSYRTWWEYFSNTFHNNPALEDRHRVIHLHTSANGDAKKFLKQFTQTGDQYQKTLAAIQERYGDPIKLIQFYLADLAALPNLHDEQSVTLEDTRSNLDQIKSLLQGLTSAGHNDSAIVQGWIFDKMPNFRIHEAIKELDVSFPKRDFSIESLMARLEASVAADEFIQLRRVNKATPSEEIIPATTLVNHSKNAKRKKLNHSPAKPPSHTNKPGSSNTQGQSSQCLFCSAKHASLHCTSYSSFISRRQRLIDLKRCTVCYKTDHIYKDCPSRDRECRQCRIKGHQSPMCVQYMKSMDKGDSKDSLRRKDPRNKKVVNSSGQPQQTSDEKSQASGPPASSTFLETFITYMIINNNRIQVRGIIDGGSNTSYIHNNILKRLKINSSSKVTLMTSTFGSNNPTVTPSSRINVTLIGLDGRQTQCALYSSDCIVGSSSLSPPVNEVANTLPPGYEYADPDLFRDHRRTIEILIGNDLKNLFVRLNRDKKVAEGLILRPTVFGWIPSGMIIQPPIKTCHTLTVIKSNKNVREIKDKFVRSPEITSLWELEVLGIKNSELVDSDSEVIEFFRKTTRFDKDSKRYVVAWPRRTHNLNLSTHYRMCVARLKALLRDTEPETLAKYNEVFEQYRNLGIIETIPANTKYPCHYMPHKPVNRDGNIRPVFDGSAKLKSGNSLNDSLHAGPSLTCSLLEILLNARIHEILLCADIEKAFLQILLDVADRDLVRFLWVEDWNVPLQDIKIIIYRFTRTPFGVVSCPFLLNMVLSDHLSELKDEILLIARKRFYVDNFVQSVSSLTMAAQIYRSLTESLEAASFNLRHWTSNSREFENMIPLEKRLNEEGIISLLGIGWNRESDTLSIRFKEIEESTSLTLENALSAQASVYDPLGLCAPCMLDLKLFVQKCWKQKATWGQHLPHLEAEFRKLMVQREEIRQLTFPRYLWKTSSKKGTYELHCFSDASKWSFGCCIYLIHKIGYSAEAELVFAKGRVAPLQPRSIPELELLGAVVGKRAIISVREALNINIEKSIVWCDATTVLQWLASPKVNSQFVNNRIIELRKASDLTFRYLPSEDNPADVLSRGQRATDLQHNELWWHGPSWVTQECLWPTFPPNVSQYETSSKSIVTLLTKREIIPHTLLSDKFEKRYSLWKSFINHILKIPPIAWLYRKRNYNSVESFKRAEMILLRLIQNKYFSKEQEYLKGEYIINSDLCLFLDSDGLIRCKNRLELSSLEWNVSHPIYLPRESPLVRWLIHSVHIETCHSGSNATLAQFRAKYYITKARALVNSVIHRCPWCRRWKGGPFKLPPMPPFPLVRTAPVVPFHNVGVDCFGPFRIRLLEGEVRKVYGVIFACLVTRAIHLELVYDMSADQFLQALIRFTSRRGKPEFVVSDNGKNFVFVQPLVGETVELTDPKLKDFFENNGINWYFIKAYQPWKGGAYERLIGIVKTSLMLVLGKRIVDLSTLHTTFCQVEYIVNCRPLTHISPDEIEPPLTPNSFLLPFRTAKSDNDIQVSLPPTDSSASKLILGYKKAQNIVEMFRTQFKKRYLTLLRDNYRRLHPAPKGAAKFVPRIRETVLISDDRASRAKWPLGIIESLDQRKGQAQVRIIDWIATNKALANDPHSLYKTKVVSKSVKTLHPLEIPYEETTQPQVSLFPSAGTSH